MIDIERITKDNIEKLVTIRRLILIIILTFYVCSKFEKIIFNNLNNSAEIKIPFFNVSNAFILTILGVVANILLISLYELSLIFIKEKNKKGAILLYKCISAVFLIYIYNDYLDLLRLNFFHSLNSNIPLLFDGYYKYIILITLYLVVLFLSIKRYFNNLKFFWKNTWQKFLIFLKY
ncbi:hypothetical protein HU002_04445 [Staphylococcus sp. SS251]|nr:hypothetical protein [Staphylococcus singaporensis]MBE5677463.1 hypothetical protein [Staphylococcus singaporensis]